MSILEKLEDLLEAPLFQEGDIVEIMNLPNSTGYVQNIFNFDLPCRRVIHKIKKVRDIKTKRISYSYVLQYEKGVQLSFYYGDPMDTVSDMDWTLEEKYLKLIKRGV